MRRRTPFKRDAGPSARVAFCVFGISRSPVSVIGATLPCPSIDVRAPYGLPCSGRLPGLAASPQHDAPRCWASVSASFALGSVTGRSADTMNPFGGTRLWRRGARRSIPHFLRISVGIRASCVTMIVASGDHRGTVRRRSMARTGPRRPTKMMGVPEGRGAPSWFQPIPACPDPWIAGDGGGAPIQSAGSGHPAGRLIALPADTLIMASVDYGLKGRQSCVLHVGAGLPPIPGSADQPIARRQARPILCCADRMISPTQAARPRADSATDPTPGPIRRTSVQREAAKSETGRGGRA
jgi:hypothetical protein